MPALKLPVDLQSFEIIRREGLLYVDKTPYIHRMLEEGRYYFMARPRRTRGSAKGFSFWESASTPKSARWPDGRGRSSDFIRRRRTERSES